MPESNVIFKIIACERLYPKIINGHVRYELMKNQVKNCLVQIDSIIFLLIKEGLHLESLCSSMISFSGF